jgi:hypothetical protein
MAGATTEREALFWLPKVLNVSSMPTTVPNRPIKGDVEAIIERSVKPLVALRLASLDAAPKIALFGSVTRLKYVCSRELFETVWLLPI